MFNVLKILRWEVIGFLMLLSGMLIYRMLTRSISLRGLLLRKDGTGQVSPERVQLLVATLAVSAKYVGAAIHSTGTTMPGLKPAWICVFGASSGLYASVKAATTYFSKK